MLARVVFNVQTASVLCAFAISAAITDLAIIQHDVEFRSMLHRADTPGPLLAPDGDRGHAVLSKTHALTRLALPLAVIGAGAGLAATFSVQLVGGLLVALLRRPPLLVAVPAPEVFPHNTLRPLTFAWVLAGSLISVLSTWIAVASRTRAPMPRRTVARASAIGAWVSAAALYVFMMHRRAIKI